MKKIAAFEKTFEILQQRAQKMLALPLEIMLPEQLTSELNAIA